MSVFALMISSSRQWKTVGVEGDAGLVDLLVLIEEVHQTLLIRGSWELSPLIDEPRRSRLCWPL